MAVDTALTISPELYDRAQAINKALRSAGLSIVTAESCTAGMIAAVLSRADGAGEVLHGGFVTYTKAQKTGGGTYPNDQMGLSLLRYIDALRYRGAPFGPPLAVLGLL